MELKMYLVLFVFLSGCSALPEMALNYDEKATKELSNFELCRTYWDFDITDYQFNKSEVPKELRNRNLSGDDCFDILLAEHGVSAFCDRYNRAVLRGEPSARIGFATEISRPVLKQGFEARDLNCYTSDYTAKAHNRGDPSRSRVTEVFDSLTESIQQQRSSKTVCRETIYDTVECKTSK